MLQCSCHWLFCVIGAVQVSLFKAFHKELISICCCWDAYLWTTTTSLPVWRRYWAEPNLSRLSIVAGLNFSLSMGSTKRSKSLSVAREKLYSKKQASKTFPNNSPGVSNPFILHLFWIIDLPVSVGAQINFHCSSYYLVRCYSLASHANFINHHCCKKNFRKWHLWFFWLWSHPGQQWCIKKLFCNG